MIFTLYIYDRFCNCLYYRSFSRPLPSSMSMAEEQKLVYGVVFSARAMSERLSSAVGESSDPDGGFMAFQTSGFKLHSFETPTRYTFVLLTAVPTTGSAFDNRSASPAVPQTAQVLEDLRKLYSDCFVPQVVRNPLARLPTESYIVSSDNRMIPASMRKTPDLCPEMVFGTDSSPIMLGSTFDKMVLFWANGLSYSGLTPEGKAM
ncbi:hypothetical protein H696_03641 [Fonticula alba]|uniref:Trafficking protein particle complex subunit n=1 Tax=Fonticula alba TaxID=691883 RepID=A0A058Z9I4_FONAL|nr:hypothetical protein H696_03641 [Fonticula alba]KCV70182.1 hypothetical protein H696_03641 [Fonticula alba]|eukprot:XP_009495788.1 hypothetical protein H696_03641 [Fonticula alba]